MESLSRPPHRRKHSSATNTHSYSDVFLSNGNGKKASLQAQEYAEIFAASSNIPVLDLSSLENPVVSGSGRVDYSNIFGGLRNDDVAVPYEELIRSSSKPPQQQRFQADARSPSQESRSLNSSERAIRSSSEASDQSPNGVKQQINLSFNKTSQMNKDESNGKTHIAQFHAVPAFTRFVDEASKPQKKVEDKKHVSSLKREVSRTWSFSADVEANNKSKGVGLNWDKFHTPEKLHIPSEFDIRSQSSKLPSFDSPSKNNDKMGSRQSKLPSFSFQDDDAREKISGENSPEFFDWELDENSIAAVSAAHLKKAIEQAQESIRIAKMIMDRSGEGLQDGAKPRSKSASRIKDKKKIRIDHEVVNHSKDKIASESYERSNPMVTGVGGKLAPSFSHSDPLIDTRKAEVERVMEHVETAKEHAEVAAVVDENIFPSLGKDERLRVSGKIVEQEMKGGNVESLEACKEAPSGAGLVDDTEPRDVNLMSRLVENINSMLFRNKLAASPAEKIDTGKVNKEDLEVIPDHKKGSKELAESFHGNSELNHEPGRSVIEPSDQLQATPDHPEEPGNDIELLASGSDTSPVMVKIVEQEREILRTVQEDQVFEDPEHVTNDDEESDTKLKQTDELVSSEHPAMLSPEIHDLMNGSRIEKDSLDQEEMKYKTQYVEEGREDDLGHEDSFGMEENLIRQTESHQKFGSGVQLNEDTEEEINHRDPEIILDVEEVGMKDIRDHEPEIDEKTDHPHDIDGEHIPRELEQMEELDTNTSDSYGSTEMEADNPAAVQNSDVFQDAEETKVEENHLQFQFQEVIYDKDDGGAVDSCNSDMCSVSNDNHHDEGPESCDLDFNAKKEECQDASRGYNEKVTPSSGIDEVNEVDQQSHVEGIEMPETCGLSQTDSEENVVGSKFVNTNKAATFDGMNDYFVDMEADNEENMSKDEDGFGSADEISDAVEESTAENGKQTSPESLSDDNEKPEFDITYVGQEFERTSGSDGESLSRSSVDNLDGISGHESEESAEVLEDMNASKDEIKDDTDTDMASTERKSADEQNNEPKGKGKTEGDVAAGQKIERSVENPTGASTMGHKDAKEKTLNFDKDDHQQRIEAIKKGREREKHRIAVERAIREVRERAFAEARERAERAAVEKAAAEARQRAIAEAREKHDKASIEAKLKAERAAVERATKEALERARVKAWSQKTSTDARKLVERSNTEKFTSSSRNNELKHSVSSSDLEAVEGTSTDSAQRQKAKLEKHNRIMERAAKALEEKNMRDLVAQKEQAERNRLAQTLDAEVKRWAMGKEGNLRALLSTLQYILGTNSGWQPISLTEIITTAAVKKAYRKATLYVHPDKLQQRGANIQQKYICEKVFDLLKAAWNKFNSEEQR